MSRYFTRSIGMSLQPRYNDIRNSVATMEQPTVALNFHDVQLYESDVALFGPRQWLNDNAINFYFQYLYHSLCTVAGGRGQEVLFVDPAVVSCLLWQCEDEDEYRDVARGLDLKKKHLCFIPVNDNSEFGGSSSHWSLLVFDRSSQRFKHFDSSAGHNADAAQRVAQAFELLLKFSSTETDRRAVENVRGSPQQTNGYDCGVYVLMTAEYLCRAHLGEPLPTVNDHVTPARATALRVQVPGIIRQLQQEAAA